MSESTARDAITNAFKAYYSEAFETHGANAKGVDWINEDVLTTRYDMMLRLLPQGLSSKPTVLDVGCGYGGLLSHAKAKGLELNYTGIDLSEEMVRHGQATHPDATFIAGDFFDFAAETRFDYVFCNGLLTQKLTASHLEMDRYARDIIARLYALSTTGAVANLISNRVNYFADNLFYKSPVEALGYCMGLGARVRLDHTYAPFEFAVYMYRPEALD